MTTAEFDTDRIPADVRDASPAGLVLLLDVDGTLAPIVDDPAEAGVPAETLALVQAAVERCALVGIVTGRTMQRALEMAPVEGAHYAAVHGMHLRGPDGSDDVCEVAKAARMHVEAAATMAQTVGWHYEDKDHTVTVHLRQRGGIGQAVDPKHVKAQLDMVLHPTAVEVHEAKQALEIRPAGARTKADAVAQLVEAAGDDASAVVYMGDDRTDIDALRALDAVAAGRDMPVLRVAVGGSDAIADLVDAADLVLDRQADVAPLIGALVGS